ncbi:MAG: PQQ-binding-like beta-propeller repeat protein [Gemmatimonadaceae bacterium]|nr:PQQ-binding-like beta-propeller repeat protein [Gemmatimonadaceae bacterium]
MVGKSGVVRVVLTAVAVTLTACGSEGGTAPRTGDSTALVRPPPPARDTITVRAWARSSVTFPYTLDRIAIRSTSAFLTTGTNAVSAIDPRTGTVLWTRTDVSPGSFAGAAGVFQFALGAFDARQEVIVDALTGATRYTAPVPASGYVGTIGAVGTTVIGRTGSDTVVARNAHTGSLLWKVRVPFGDCGLIESARCLHYAGHGGTAFHFIRLSGGVVGGRYELVRVSDAGVVQSTAFVDPTAGGFPTFAMQPAVAVDSAGRVVVVTTFTGTTALDGATGAILWSAVRLSVSNGVLMEQPVVLLTGGADPLVHLVFRYMTSMSGGYSRETIRQATTGRVVRQVLRPAVGLDAVSVRPCGDAGMVLLRTGGRFIHTDTRTGTETAGQIVDATTGAPVEPPATATWVETFAPGALVYATGSGPDALVGFPCAP